MYRTSIVLCQSKLYNNRNTGRNIVDETILFVVYMMGYDEEDESYKLAKTKEEYQKYVSTYRYRNVIARWQANVFWGIMAPIKWFKETLVKPNQKDYPWYHQKFRRVQTIDQCYEGDYICIFEAEEQYIRDREVEEQLIAILLERLEECRFYHAPDASQCDVLEDVYNENRANLLVKFGDLGMVDSARGAYMKQKHRLIWERRHGPIGTGRNPNWKPVIK